MLPGSPTSYATAPMFEDALYNFGIHVNAKDCIAFGSGKNALFLLLCILVDRPQWGEPSVPLATLLLENKWTCAR